MNRTAVLSAPGTITMHERAVPAPGPNDVVIEVRAVGVCGSDVHYYRHGRIGDFVVDAPLVLGHEASGRITAIGSAVTTVNVGQRVAVEPGVPCGTCRQCRSGRYNLCPDVRFLATPPVDGAFTQYLSMPASFAHPIPDTLSDVAGALIEPLSVGVWANEKVRSGPGDRLLITGAGPVGLLAASVARARGVTTVILTDPSAERRQTASTMNFTALAPDDLRGPFDAAIECSGAPSAIHAAVSLLAPAGRAVLVGMSAVDDVSIPVSALQRHEITLTGSFRYANTYPTAIALAVSGHVDLDALTTRSFGLDEVADALTASTTDPSIAKAIVLPQSMAR